MRYYRLASSEYKNTVNLQKYEDLITKTIHSIAPTTTVIVEPSFYLIVDDISKGDAIKIGRSIAKSVLGQFSTSRPILFVGTEINDTIIESEDTEHESRDLND